MSKEKIEKFLNLNKYKYFHKKTTTSTMEDVKKFIKLNNKNCIFTCDEQSNGRGRRGNIWDSPKGNIYCSISFNNFLNPQNHFLFSILLSISIKMSIENFNKNLIEFKWPNDLYHNGKKFSGMIFETFQFNESNLYIIAGFGINFNSSPSLIDIKTTYLKKFTNLNNIDDYLLLLFKILFLNLKKLINDNFDDLIGIFKNSLMFQDEKINILMHDNSLIHGIFKGINTDGSLILISENKKINIYNGSIIK